MTVVQIPYQLGALSWKDNRILHTDPTGGNEILIDTITGQKIGTTPTPTLAILSTNEPTPGTSTPRMHSPDQQYFIECTKNDTRAYRSADKELLGQIPLELDPCGINVIWAPTSARAVIRSEEDLYLWEMDGSPPRKFHLGSYLYDLSWSTDGNRLVTLQFKENQDGMFYIPAVVNANGNLKQWSNLRFNAEDILGSVDWISSNIIEVQMGYGACCGIYYYFDAETGRQFPPWINGYDLSRPPSFSPDLLWRVTDSTSRVWEGEAYASADHFVHRYEVLSFQTGQSYLLMEGTDQYLDWVGWTLDTKMFYFINQPAYAEAPSQPGLPFGLFALEPRSHSIKSLFEQALFAKLSPDQNLAWVIYPNKRTDGTHGLDAGILNLRSGTIVGRQPFSKEIVYPDSRSETTLPGAWSNNSNWFVWDDELGNITLLNAAGDLYLLVSNLTQKNSGLPIHYTWSPDDRHLLIRHERYTWVVSIPIT